MALDWVREHGYVVTEWVLRLVMLLVVPIRRSPADAKVWLLLIFFQPLLGVAFYLVFGSNKTPKWRREQLRKLPKALEPIKNSLLNDQSLFQNKVEKEFSDEVDLAQRLGTLPLLGKNRVSVHTQYDASIDTLVDDIERSQVSVHLVFYIFAPDETGKKVAEALKRAAARGVKCRLLMDAVGSRKGLGKLATDLRANGVQVMDILPFGFFRKRAARFDLRNHRKIAVIDGHIAYVGSQNIVDGNQGDLTYQELVVRVTGPIVWQLQYIFISDWYLETNELLDNPIYFPETDTSGTVPLQCLPSGPDFPFENNQMVLLSLLHSARKRICLVTPYFIPDDPMLHALETAAVKGVEVTLIVSAKADTLIVNLAQRSYYEQLLEAGIKIFLYEGKFLHAKHVTIDDSVSVVGSFNLDIRSFNLNAELMLLCYEQKLNREFIDVEQGYLRHCRPLELAEWEKRNRLLKVGENLSRLFSPLL